MVGRASGRACERGFEGVYSCLCLCARARVRVIYLFVCRARKRIVCVDARGGVGHGKVGVFMHCRMGA